MMGDGSQTGYAHIHRLSPAYRLVLDPSGIRLERYWYPGKNPKLHLADGNVYYEKRSLMPTIRDDF